MEPRIKVPKSFSPEEKRRLIKSAKSQEEALLKFFRKYPHSQFTYYELWQLFGWDKDSTKRSISNLSNSKPTGPWRDGNGEPPLLKLDRKRKNPASGIRISLYQWNQKYGKKKANEQASLFQSERCTV